VLVICHQVWPKLHVRTLFVAHFAGIQRTQNQLVVEKNILPSYKNATKNLKLSVIVMHSRCWRVQETATCNCRELSSVYDFDTVTMYISQENTEMTGYLECQ